MANLNLKVITGETELAAEAYTKLQPVLASSGIQEVEHEQEADCRVVLGGDGTMLRETRKDISSEVAQGILRVVPIFGIKAGNPRSKGMLLNDLDGITDKDEIIEAIQKSTTERFHYLGVIAIDSVGQVINLHAFNDVSTIRAKAQTAATQVVLGRRTIMERAMGDGFIVCTPQGSTAYNANAGGVVTPALNTIQLTGNNSDFSNLVLDDSTEIELVTLEPEKRPQRMEVDGMLISDDIRAIQIGVSEFYSLLNFIKGRSFRDKMIQEALRIRR